MQTRACRKPPPPNSRRSGMRVRKPPFWRARVHASDAPQTHAPCAPLPHQHARTRTLCGVTGGGGRQGAFFTLQQPHADALVPARCSSASASVRASMRQGTDTCRRASQRCCACVAAPPLFQKHGKKKHGTNKHGNTKGGHNTRPQHSTASNRIRQALEQRKATQCNTFCTAWCCPMRHQAGPQEASENQSREPKQRTKTAFGRASSRASGRASSRACSRACRRASGRVLPGCEKEHNTAGQCKKAKSKAPVMRSPFSYRQSPPRTRSV